MAADLSSPRWILAHGRSLVLDRPCLIAILNLTPDSFYEGSRLATPAAATEAARRAIDQGADALDLGGESTRPGAERVSSEEQIRRVIPVIEAMRRQGSPYGAIPISIDTTLAAVARAAIDAGAGAINDVSAGTEDPGMFDLAAERRAGLILMHRLLPPARDSYSDHYEQAPVYDDVVATVLAFLEERSGRALASGVARESIVIDPGLGFGKTVSQNLELIRRSAELQRLGFPVLSALSRKSFVGRASGLSESTPADRLEGTLALSTSHLLAGARLFRIHDVAEHTRALMAAWALLGPSP